MPRKSTKKATEEAVETKAKATRKKKEKVEEAPAKVSIDVADMVNWTDEECEAKDKEIRFRVSDMRDVLKAFVSANEKFSTTLEKFNLLKTTLAKGQMTGYKIRCPHCQREYVVNSMDLHRTSTIQCKICGTEYKEDENIKGITVAGENVSEEVKMI